MHEGGEVQILLAEDNPRDAEMTMRALRKIHFTDRLQWVRDGEEALEFLLGQGRHAGRDVASVPKLILLDLKMPKVDGIEVLRRIKASDALRAIPVVIMTSSAEERDIVEAYDLGVNSYIVKPVQFQDFIDTVAKVGLYWILTNRAPN
ncbi:MAG TPA: response regulator [Burkholderiales bacterium]|jgi:CheY-like chemotaxis protein|nr:response regulator [Burkholderiales bacterium]